MFSLPQTTAGDPEGSTENAPLKLDGVDKGDFEKLLEVMYPLEITDTPWLTMTKEGWVSVLRLATMWIFKEIRALAIDKLSKLTMDPIEQILLAKEYNVPQWLRSGYDTVARRSDILSLVEAEKLGYLTTIRLFQLREQARTDGWARTCNSTYRGSGHSGPPPVGETHRFMENIFSEELRVVNAAYVSYLPDSEPHTLRCPAIEVPCKISSYIAPLTPVPWNV